MVRTLTSPFHLIDSGPIVGASLDDLAPPALSSLSGQLTADGTTLQWSASTDPNATYRVYRGTESGFELHEGSLIASIDQLSYLDEGASGHFYAVTAVDASANESSAIRLGPDGTLDTPGGPRVATFALRGLHPNPARGSRLTLDLSLPNAERATAQVFDVGGRVVAEREVGSLGAGDHRVEWTLSRPLPPGLYHVRLASAMHAQVLRLAVIH
jgi:hypothetical protein